MLSERTFKLKVNAPFQVKDRRENQRILNIYMKMLVIQASTGRFLFLKSENPKWFCGPELASD